MASTLSIIVPVLDEARLIADALQALAPFRQRGAEVIVVDGGSRDDTLELARPYADKAIAAPRGRAAQMNAGAAIATGDVLMFLHADTRLPPEADRRMREGLARSGRPWDASMSPSRATTHGCRSSRQPSICARG